MLHKSSFAQSSRADTALLVIVNHGGEPPLGSRTVARHQHDIKLYVIGLPASVNTSKPAIHEHFKTGQ
jgi:hypothetical protein